MAKTDFKSPDEYVSAQPKRARTILRVVRAIIRRSVPAAVEGISYQILGYKLAGRPMLGLAGWKEHYSLYPASNAMLSAFKGALTPYLASKSTLRFPLSEPVPAKLIERIVKFRAQEALRQAKARLLR